MLVFIQTVDFIITPLKQLQRNLLLNKISLKKIFNEDFRIQLNFYKPDGPI